MKYRIQADAYEFTLRDKDDYILGHYPTIDGLLDAVRHRLLREKSKSARDLEEFLKVVISSQQEIRAEIKKIAFVASKRKAPAVPEG